MNVKHLRLVSAFKGKHTFHVSRYSSRYFCSDGVFEIDIVSHVEIYSCFKDSVVIINKTKVYLLHAQVILGDFGYPV